MFTDVKHNIDRNNESQPFSQASIFGMHQIKEFYLKHNLMSKVSCDQMSWKKIAIYPNAQVLVQYMNDSIAWYSSKSDTTMRSLELSSKDDSLFKCKFTYTIVAYNEWLFKGILKNDSISFISTKMDFNSSNLLKGFGKVKWVL